MRPSFLVLKWRTLQFSIFVVVLVLVSNCGGVRVKGFQNGATETSAAKTKTKTVRPGIVPVFKVSTVSSTNNNNGGLAPIPISSNSKNNAKGKKSTSVKKSKTKSSSKKVTIGEGNVYLDITTTKPYIYPMPNYKYKSGLSLANGPIDSGIGDSNWVGISKGYHGKGKIDSDVLDDEALHSPNKIPLIPTPTITTPQGLGLSDLGLGMIPIGPESDQGLLVLKIQEMEKMVATVTRNIEVMQQNTQVISKGFNILSSRVNKVSADHEEIHSKLGQRFVAIDQSLLQLQKNFTNHLKEIEIKSDQEFDNMKKSGQDLQEGQIKSTQEQKKWMSNFAEKMTTWKSDWDNESKILAEMVKALAEIQKSEKSKLENLTKQSEQEIHKLQEKFTTFQVEEANKWETVAKNIGTLRSDVQENNKTMKEESEGLKNSVGNLSKHVDQQLKRFDESMLEQNMAHNMAHEHIALKLDKIEEQFNDQQKVHKYRTFGNNANETSVINLVSYKLENAERNISSLLAAQKKVLDKIVSLEETDVSILSKIADIRNVHKQDNLTTNQEIARLGQRTLAAENSLKSLDSKVEGISERIDSDKLLEVGGLSMNYPTSATLRNSETGQSVVDMDADEIRDRFGTIEENVAELWRSQKETQSQSENFKTTMTDLQQSHQKDNEDTSLQIMEVKIATKMLTELVRNSTKNLFEIEKRVEHFPHSEQSSGTAGRTKGYSHGVNDDEIECLRNDLKSVRDNIANLWDSNKNVTKAQEFFLFKLLELDLEHKKDNKTLSEHFSGISNTTEDMLIEVSRSEERINKVVQQFEITDAEQVKIREELLNIKDRLASLEENYANLWKINKKFVGEFEEFANSLDNMNLVYGTELRNISGELATSKDNLENITKMWNSMDTRMSNVELLMDIEVSGESNSSELTKLKSRLESSEKDIQELWKSSEILSFQQQVMGENFKFLQMNHENDTSFSRLERLKTKQDTTNLIDIYQNLTQRVGAVEKYNNPPYETKTIDFDIRDWHASVAGGLKDQYVTYEIGDLLGIPSSWKTFAELSGNQLSIFNVLLTADQPMFNEFEAEFLDADGRVFSSMGPEQHLYKGKNAKISWRDVISLQTLEKPQNKLVSRNILRVRIKVKVYPKVEKEVQAQGPSEKQLLQWEIKDLYHKLKEIPFVHDDQAFVDLNITKEFAAGHSWGGQSLWKSSLLVRSINHQKYLGINMELIQNDGGWKELQASYNVSMLDAQSRIVKDFSITSNDFIAVSARHSYFMLVKDVEEVLKRGDFITLRVYFDLLAKRKSFDVEVIR